MQAGVMFISRLTVDFNVFLERRVRCNDIFLRLFNSWLLNQIHRAIDIDVINISIMR